MKKDSILYLVLFTFVATALFVTLLALANEGTKPLVAANREFSAQSAVLDERGIAEAGQDEAPALYRDSVKAF